MTIPPRFLDELRSRITLSDVIGRKIRVQRAGREFKACCPFHKEKTPSFTINDEKQFYHCFGCGAHGSAFDFLMQHDNLSFIEAVETLAADAGMQVPKASPEAIKKANKAKTLHSLLEDATKWMEEQLRKPENREAYKYITERGVSEKLLSAYRVGYAPADRQAVRTYMKAQGYDDKQMIEAGILRPAGKDGQPYAFFRERVMFPVPDRRGRIVAYGGRILPDHLRPPDKGDYTPAKYMNSSDTPLFHKGSMLYGEPHARQAAIEEQPILVVEGYLDVMACAKAGFKGAVAPLGTALTDSQIPILWQMIPKDEKVPILCFDGDNAGRRAAARAVERILPQLKPNHSARIAFLPDGQDPDSLINAQGAGAFEKVLKSAMSLVDFLWFHHTEGKALDTPEARAGLNKSLEQAIAQIPDRDVQYYYSQAIREKTRKAYRAQGYNQQGTYHTKYGKKGKTPEAPIRRPAYNKIRLIEAALLAALINHPHIYDDIEETAGILSFSDKRLDAIRQHVLSTLSQEQGDGDALDAAFMRHHLIDRGFESDIKGILSDSVYTHAGFAKPETEEADVKAGWDNALKILEKMRVEQDLKAAVNTAMDDISADNENMLRALHDHKRGQEAS